MIFSLSNQPTSQVIATVENTDIFCFFEQASAVVLPQEIWFHSFITSLRQKKNVLVLEVPLDSLSSIDQTKRWMVEENWLWLAPRSTSVLLEAPQKSRSSYQELKILLSQSK